MDRLEFLKRLGALTVGASLIGVDVKAMTTDVEAEDIPEIAAGEKINYEIEPMGCTVPKPVTVMILGAGNRGARAYAKYAEKFPNAMKVVGVADLNPYRRNRLAKKHNIPAENTFSDFRDALARPKLADAVIISLPDNLHYEPCMKALELGYDVLLEKPVAPTEKECRNILKQAKKYNRIVAVCHVLRYAPYFIALKKTLESGAIGDIVSVQHMEPIQYAHMAHSYVRGNWPLAAKTTPIILAKSCHDLDIMRWLIGKPCKSIAAEGSLHLFRPENMPKGAPERCTDGCPHEAECPYSAIDIYVRKKKHIYALDLPRVDEKLIYEKLKTSRFGRCAFRCENDQCDHYVAILRFEDDITASFTMDAFTPWGGRRTRIMGTKGYIEGDMKKFTFYDFRTGHKSVWDKKVKDIPEYKDAGHGGGDLLLVRDFIRAVSAQDESLLSSTIDVSIESHVMGFMAEKSRKSNKKFNVKL
ncbi:MAG: Gfo/Idh/MocA family oxidoreductase [Alistipes sp.]|nr:Gfo/Idh/MocA family oxidoreductase [Alistipes sp.]